MARNYGAPFNKETKYLDDKTQKDGRSQAEKNKQAAIETAKNESTWEKIKRTVGDIYGDSETLTHPGRNETPSR